MGQIGRRTDSRGSSHSLLAARYCWAADRVVGGAHGRLLDETRKAYLHRVERHVHNVHRNEDALDPSETLNPYMVQGGAHTK